jgi:hypothetical protein
MFPLLLLDASPVKARNVSDAGIPAIYGWGVSIVNLGVVVAVLSVLGCCLQMLKNAPEYRLILVLMHFHSSLINDALGLV